MTERPSLAVGLMSGTSLDGMDAALVRLRDPTHAELLQFVSRPYSDSERAELSSGMNGATAPQLARLHARLGEWAADAVQQVLEAARVPASDLDLIAFHGQTIWHEPPLVSWQLGEPAILAERFGVRVVHNFRARDVAAGGQGAPLVPVADVLLFGGSSPRLLLNIGGMANLTYVPGGTDDNGAFAFDTGPGMAIIDALARAARPGMPYDRDAEVSRGGTPDPALLAELMSDPYFSEEPPKSTGRERFGDRYAAAICDRCPGPDGVATAVELTVRSIADAIVKWTPEAELVISGGGARHPGVTAGLRRELENRRGGAVTIRKFDEVFFDGDAKEAVAFALLGYLTVHGQPGNLPAATGARGPRVLGCITPP